MGYFWKYVDYISIRCQTKLVEGKLQSLHFIKSLKHHMTSFFKRLFILLVVNALKKMGPTHLLEDLHLKSYRKISTKIKISQVMKISLVGRKKKIHMQNMATMLLIMKKIQKKQEFMQKDIKRIKIIAGQQFT